MFVKQLQKQLSSLNKIKTNFFCFILFIPSKILLENFQNAKMRCVSYFGKIGF